MCGAPKLVISAAKDWVVTALDELESTSALQHSHQTSLLDALKRADKAHFPNTTTGEEIFNAVMKARGACEGCQRVGRHLRGHPSGLDQKACQGTLCGKDPQLLYKGQERPIPPAVGLDAGDIRVADTCS
ncbi:hypothetical protein H4582DRAFT_2055056 [Lactarius indigo]|nr:hypothetical protein H4582DRAFT_2055056 [Lactarius indigo]